MSTASDRYANKLAWGEKAESEEIEDVSSTTGWDSEDVLRRRAFFDFEVMLIERELWGTRVSYRDPIRGCRSLQSARTCVDFSILESTKNFAIRNSEEGPNQTKSVRTDRASQFPELYGPSSLAFVLLPTRRTIKAPKQGACTEVLLFRSSPFVTSAFWLPAVEPQRNLKHELHPGKSLQIAYSYRILTSR